MKRSLMVFLIAAVALFSLAAEQQPSPSGSLIEAESGLLSGGAKVMSDHGGYSGSGFVAGFEGAGASVRWQIAVSASGASRLSIRYANAWGGSDQYDALYVDGAKAADVRFPILKDWETWGVVEIAVSLAPGQRTVEIRRDRSDSGVVNIDSIALR